MAVETTSYLLFQICTNFSPRARCKSATSSKLARRLPSSAVVNEKSRRGANAAKARKRLEFIILCLEEGADYNVRGTDQSRKLPPAG